MALIQFARRMLGLALFVLLTVTTVQADALQRLKDYLAIDTVNPPGNETQAADYLGKLLAAAGIDYEIVESAPGRGNLWARLEGGDEPALILLHHMDVVPATADAWDSDPLTPVERDGYLVARGALDTKSLGIMHLEAFLALHSSAQALDRDVIFMATADEEAGGLYGAGWLVQNRPEVFTGVGYLLNEGGLGTRSATQQYFKIEVAQKRPYWFRLTASDVPGHGSRPLPTSAPTRLIAALNRVHEMPFPPRVVAPVRDMFSRIAPYSEAEWQSVFSDIDMAIADAGLLSRLQAEQPGMHALLRNTCSITVLSGSQKINVVPPSASAELDCRILPDQDAATFRAELESRIADEHISVEELLLFGAGQSGTDTELYGLMEAVLRAEFPAAGVVPAVAGGFTDSHFFRDLGIASYGFSPMLVPEAVMATAHGNNERIEIAAFRNAVRIMAEMVATFVVQH